MMTTLNRDAARVMADARAHALTDITGFGLLGHLRNMAAASGVAATIWSDLVPVIPAARAYVRNGVAPGGTHANRRFLSRWVDYDADLIEWEQLLLCDAQTSGGLLAALPASSAEEVVRELQAHGLACAAVVGSIDAGEAGRIRVRRVPKCSRVRRRPPRLREIPVPRPPE